MVMLGFFSSVVLFFFLIRRFLNYVIFALEPPLLDQYVIWYVGDQTLFMHNQYLH